MYSSADVGSAGFGLNWGHTRTWTGLNNGSANGNGWAVAELPYLVVGGGTNGGSGPSGATVDTTDGTWPGTRDDHRISIVSGGGARTFGIAAPGSGSTYASHATWDAERNTLAWDLANDVVRLTDPNGNVTEFHDVFRAGDDPSHYYYSSDPNRPMPRSLGVDGAMKYGRFKRFIAADGKTQVRATYNAAGELTGVTRAEYDATDNAVGGRVERFRYDYTGDSGFPALTNDLVTAANGPVPRLIARVTLERSGDGGGNWSAVRSADYTYYTGRLSNGAGGHVNDPNGRLGDLKLAVVRDPAGAAIDSSYYRYYKLTGEGQENASSKGPTNKATTTGGPDPLAPVGLSFTDAFLNSGLKSVVSGAAFARLAAAHQQYESATDAQLRPFADHVYFYERWHDHASTEQGLGGFGYGGNYPWRVGYRMGTRYRVVEEVDAAAGCSTCSGGQGSVKVDYYLNFNDPDASLGFHERDFNVWRVRTTEYLPDTTNADVDNNGRVDADQWADNDRKVLYTNELGLVMMSVVIDAKGTASATDDTAHATYYRYDDQGRVVLTAHPSAVLVDDPSDLATLETVTDGSLVGFTGPAAATHLKNEVGLIETTEYASSTTATESTPGDVLGYVKATRVRRGDSGTGTPVLTYSKTYLSRTDRGADGTLNTADDGGTVYAIAAESVYRNSDGTGAQTTTYDYTWLGNTTRIASTTVNRPVVSAAQNGPGAATARTALYDAQGRTVWSVDGEGYLTYTEYYADTGAVKTRVVDANPSLISSPPVAAPTRSGSLPAALHLATSFVADGLGRTTKATDPNGNVTHTVYNDAAHEVRTYRGWNATAGTTTGPIEVTRQYRPTAGAASGQRTVYTETLTTSAAPAVSGTSGSYVPTGSEAITAGNVQSLARSLTNDAGQVVETDAYFSMAGVTYGQATPKLGLASNDSSTGNYHATLIDYDGRGRLKRTQTPSGTITRTLYDARGLATQTWVGTDDVPTSGFWSPTNNAGANMVQVSGNAYDADSNLTRAAAYTASPVTGTATGGSATTLVDTARTEATGSFVGRTLTITGGTGAGQSARITAYDGTTKTFTVTPSFATAPASGSTYSVVAERVTLYAYDWRDRLVATKTGAGPSTAAEDANAQGQIKFCDLDNLGQDTACWFYDGDGVGITTDANSDGVPDKPLASLLRAKTTKDFDDRGRVYRSSTFGVDPANGTVSTNALKTDAFHDKRGNVIKTSEPGGLVTKTAFDGAGRPTAVFRTDGGGDGGWADADDVTGDVVLEQSETAYDANGNAILITARQRFHDATGTGALGDPSSTTQDKARVGYRAFYYDAADRATHGIDVGTNGGAAYARPSAVPLGSNTVLRTGYAYDDAGRLRDVSDPRGIVTRTSYDLLGRTTQTVANHVDNGPSPADDQTTAYTHDGSGHVLTMKAVLPNSAFQTTQYVYGVGQGTGSDVASNDVLSATRYPDLTSGSPSSGQQESRTVNALGEVRTTTDRRGTVHAYTYDPLGRLTVDAATTLGGNVDGAVRRREFAFDSAGRPHTFSTYAATTGGTPTTQVLRQYNGLGQLAREYTNHSGPVNTGTTKYVGYTYAEMAGGANHSRPLTVRYPDAKVLAYGYGPSAGLNDRVGRLASLAYNNVAVEAYDYLGLGTVVRRSQAERGVDLTYVKQGAEANGDAGDQYSGLDRFGRVVDQRWIKGATTIDRHQYGYDRGGNRLWRDNLVNAAFGEVYAYDGLDRLTTTDRGTLNGTKTGLTGSASRSQAWALDATGNWAGLSTNGGAAQARTHDRQNRVTAVGATNITYDANGSITLDDNGKTLRYDAWGQQVEAKSGATSLAVYKYDALGRVAQRGTYKRYYSDQWQVLWAEGTTGSSSESAAHVWSPVYVDALVLHDRDVGLNGVDSRWYPAQDANFNVTSVTDQTGAVLERFVYDAYGKISYLSPTWASLGSSTIQSFVWGYQGLRLDGATGAWHARNRELSPTLGRWTRQDPLGYVDGANLYQFVSGNPLVRLDPLGLQAQPLPLEPPPQFPRLGPLPPFEPVAPPFEPPAMPGGGAGLGNPWVWAFPVWWFLFGPGVGTAGGPNSVVPPPPPGGPAYPPYPLPNMPFGPPAPDWCRQPRDPTCEQGCHDQYERDAEGCRALRTPSQRARCWARIADDRGNCIRDCNR